MTAAGTLCVPDQQKIYPLFCSYHPLFLDEFGEPDAIEYHMSVEPYLRRSRFLEVLHVSWCYAYIP